MSSALQTLLATLDRLPLSEQKQVLSDAVREVCVTEGRPVSEQAIQVAVSEQLAPVDDHEGLRPWTREHWQALQDAEQKERVTHRAIFRSAGRKVLGGLVGTVVLAGLGQLGQSFGWLADHWTVATVVWALLSEACVLQTALGLMMALPVGLELFVVGGQTPWDPVSATPEQQARWQACGRTRALWQAIQRSEVPLLWQDRQRLEAWSA